MTLLAGIFGYPIGHSISPAMHNAAFRQSGIDAVYEAWQTRPEDLAAGVAALREDGYLGANVTVPHKQAVMEYLDEIDDLAARIGAVNTIVNRDGRLVRLQHGRAWIHQLAPKRGGRERGRAGCGTHRRGRRGAGGGLRAGRRTGRALSR